MENFVLHSLLPTHLDTISDNGKTEAGIKLCELKKQEFQKAGKEIPKELRPSQKTHQVNNALEKYENDVAEQEFVKAMDTLRNEISKSLNKAKANLPPKWKNFFGWLSIFKTKEETNAELKVQTIPTDLEALNKVHKNMADRQKTEKESQNPNTLRTIKELLKEYKTDDNSQTLAPLQQAISQNKERQPSSWKTVDQDKNALQTSGMMTHHTKDDNTIDDPTKNSESSPTTPNPTHHENE
ncbi:MAG: hypothetical protein GY821_03485 [Gammaproteobacteria bacterium]|nr:hypothetical protein [Gammaproteobacteria bacterium]